MAKRPKGKHRLGRSLNENEQKSFHIVEFSQGKPNELSLNVLDNLAKESNQKKRRGWGRKGSADAISGQASPSSSSSFSGGTVSSGQTTTEGQVAGKQRGRKKVAAAAHAHDNTTSLPSYLAAEANAEIERRQKRRSMRRRASLAIVFAIVAVFAGIGIYNIQGELHRIEANRSLVEESGFHLGKTDQVLIDTDTFFSAPLEDDYQEKIKTIGSQLAQANQELEEARKYAVLADEDASGLDKDKEAAEAVLNSVTARQELFAVAQERLKLDSSYKEALDSYENAQEELAKANTLLLQAADVIAHTTKDTVAQSTSLLTQAASSYSVAQKGFEAVAKSYPQVKLNDYLSYIGLRQKAVQAALESNAAILLQDRKTANRYNDTYNKLDKQAVALAQKMTADPIQVLIDAYKVESAPLEERYDTLRSDIARNDSYLRKYFAE